MKIRPVSDLRNKFPEIESELQESGALFLTKNGYGSAVLLSIDEYSALSESTTPISNYGNGKAGLSQRNSSNTGNKRVGSKDSTREGRRAKSHLGFLSRYSNPDLIQYEKIAGKLHAIRKFGGADNE